MSNCHKHIDSSAVAQCSCGNFICSECRSFFDQSICTQCYHRQVIDDIATVETALKREKLKLFIAPLYFPFAIMQLVQYWGIYKSSASRDPVLNILNALVLAMVWAVIRLKIFEAARASQSAVVVYYGCFPIFSSFIKMAFMCGLGSWLVPFDLISGYFRISKLRRKKLQLIKESEIALNIAQ